MSGRTTESINAHHPPSSRRGPRPIHAAFDATGPGAKTAYRHRRAGSASPARWQMIDGIPHRVQTGVHWRDLPDRFGAWKTVYERRRLWSTDGTWERLPQRIQAEADAAEDIDRAVESFVEGLGGRRSRGWQVRRTCSSWEPRRSRRSARCRPTTRDCLGQVVQRAPGIGHLPSLRGACLGPSRKEPARSRQMIRTSGRFRSGKGRPP
ncbi:transposase [Streptomyces sp. NPDC004520]|uniref:transposase n=1 Tax=Streptomyces sp. NPDC004520 TaxID=3364702 RepID=UPI0036AD536F